jgi:dipeptide/tripeptide permease
VSAASKVLIFGGIALAAFGMLYGLHYAVFIEHQTLDAMGGALANAFVQAAEGNMPAAYAAVDGYGSTKYNYVRQVDVHSHWIGLSMLMIVLGVAFDRAHFSERVRLWLAIALLVGSVIFPLGVILQTVNHGGVLPSGLAIIGAGLVTLALAGTAWGFSRRAA